MGRTSKRRTSNYTTNGAEAFHRHFNQQFYSPHPHIHQVIIDVILKIQTESDLKITSINKNINNYRRMESIESVEHRISLWTKYRSGEIDRMKYLQIMGNCFYGK